MLYDGQVGDSGVRHVDLCCMMVWLVIVSGVGHVDLCCMMVWLVIVVWVMWTYVV